jgi:hypothetical protein
VFLRVLEIEVHLSRISAAERAHFQIYDGKTPQTPMEEDEFDPEPTVAQAQSALAFQEREIVGQFEQEVRQKWINAPSSSDSEYSSLQ